MTTRSLILHPHEVRAALAGTLGLVVRPVSKGFANAMDTPRGPEDVAAGYPMVEDEYGDAHKAVDLCPFGVPGDRLRCRETWGEVFKASTTGSGDIVEDGRVVYRETSPDAQVDPCWRPPATMPAWASRITLEVIGLRCVMASNLTDIDAELCGVPSVLCGGCGATKSEDRCIGCLHTFYLDSLKSHWIAKYGHRHPWETSWAWAVEVMMVEG